MGQERIVMSESDLAEQMRRMSRSGKYTEEVLQLVKEDYQFGLTTEEINIYLKTKLNLLQMKMVSKALRSYGVKLASEIAREDIDHYCMEVILDFYDKGIPLNVILEHITEKQNAQKLKEIYQSLLDEMEKAQSEKRQEDEKLNQSYVEQMLTEMKQMIVQIQYNDKRFDVLTEKLNEIGKRKYQDEEYEQITQILKDKEKKIRTLQEELAERKQKMKQMEEMKETKQIVYVPVQYMASITGQDGNPIPLPIMEHAQPKPSGIVGRLAKLAFKKRSRQDIVRLVASGDLDTEQLVQIRSAIEKGLTENQLLDLIHNNVPAEQMREIIEIAVLENSLQ